MPPSQPLARRLRTLDATVIGLGAMLGAGVFAAFAPAAKAAGAGLLIGLVLAGVVAYCNATASAQLAAAYPTSGGTYIYGRERLGEWWGFAAGWGFVIGKTASAAAMAMTFASYVLPEPWWMHRAVGIAAVLVLLGLNYRGVTKTVALTKVLVAITVVVLAVFVATAMVGGDAARFGTWSDFGAGGIYGVLQSAGLLFFAFAGYARIATLGEEVVEPRRTIPRAITFALGIAFAGYALVAVSALAAAGPRRLAGSSAPLADAVRVVGAAELVPLMRFGAAVASLDALLALLAGLGRTSLAMARHGDLPQWLAAVHPRYRVPHHAEVTVALVVCALVASADLRGVIGFSSFGVLVYYGIANAAAYTQSGSDRRWPRTLQVLGVLGCALLAVTLPWTSVVAGAVMFGIGLGARRLLPPR